MIPILFSREASDFTTNGLGRLYDCISCTVTEERNGIYEAEFMYPVTGRFYQQIVSNGGIIGVIHDDKHDIQPFEIYRYSAPIDGVVTFNAHHVSYGLGNVVVMPFEAASCTAALQGLRDNAVNDCPFTFWTNKQGGSGSFKLTVPDNARALLSGQEGSILDAFGAGEYEFDKYEVKLYTKRGVDHGVTIRYGKNLTDIVWTHDKSGAFNSVVPFWQNEDTVVISGLIEGEAEQYDVPWTDEYGTNITTENDEIIYFRIADLVRATPLDLSSNFEEAPTVEQLNDAARAYLTNNRPWLPDDNVEVDFVALWQSPEYADVAALQRLSLCDYVSIYYPELGVVRENAEIISVVYNVLLERYDKLTIGTPSATLAETVAEKFSGLLDGLATKAQVSAVEAAIDEASQKIIGGLGGYVVMTPNADGQPQEILIMDTDDINTAVHVIRLNKNGIGFSNNGYAGPYTSAWTIDGKFNADFIAAGTLLATYIKGGTLTLGGAGNGNGVLQVKDANGSVIGTWDNTGVTITSGTIIGPKIVSWAYTYYGSDLGKRYTALDGGKFSILSGGYWGDYSNAVEHAYISTGKFDKVINMHQPRYALGFVNAETNNYNAFSFYAWRRYGSGDENLTRAFTIDTTTSGDYGFVAAVDGYLLLPAEKGSNKGLVFARQSDWSRIQYNASNMSDYGIRGYYNSQDATGVLVGVEVAGAFHASSEVYFDSNLYVSGTKNRAVQADEYGKRLLYCYETASPMFGDVGEGVIDETGFCYVFIDPVLAATIATSQYQVFLQKYGEGDCYVAERKYDYFAVRGNPGLSFGWELKAKQADFDQERLDRFEEPKGNESNNYGSAAADYLLNLQEGRIER